MPKIINWQGKVWVSDGATRRWIPNDTAAKELFAAFPGTGYTTDQTYAAWTQAHMDSVFGPDVASLGGGGGSGVAIGTKFTAQVTE